VATDSKGKESTVSGKSFVISRVVNAPRELVFKACTEREHLAHWWGPKGMELSIEKFEPRPGGVFHYKMSVPSGFEMWGKWIFREIVAPERFVFVSTFSDPDCGITRHPMAPEWPLETLTTFTLEEQGDKTKLTIESIPINASETERETFEGGFESMKGGFKGTFDQLEEYLRKA